MTDSSDLSQWHNVTRVAWLSGGLVAISQPGPAVSVFAGIGSRLKLQSFHLRAYAELVGALRHFGYSVIGMTFITNPDEASGSSSPQFFAQSSLGAWLARDAQASWRQVAHHSGQRDSMLLSDVSARIASGIRSGQMRLQQLSHAYATQLRGQVRSLPFRDFVRFKDTNSDAVYLAIHAMFWELSVLRDTLAEFAARFAFGLTEVDSMSRLVERLKRLDSKSVLREELLQASSEASDGWLFLFTTYRNLFTHRAPLQDVAGVSFAILDRQVLQGGFKVPLIYYPLPADAANLSKKRSAGPLYATLSELVGYLSGNPPSRDVEPDALDYLATAFDRFTLIAQNLLAYSPVPPADVVLTEADLIGEIVVTKTS